jgi:hypothetical protein
MLLGRDNLINLSLYSIPIFQTFGQIKTPEEILKLARSIFPLEDEYALMAIKWLKVCYYYDNLLNSIPVLTI